MKKKILILVLALICALGLVMNVSATDAGEEDITEETPDIILGDVDGDGIVTNADVLMIYRNIYNSELYPLPVNCGHSYGDWTVITPTTCESDGKMARACTKCMVIEETTVTGGHVFDAEQVCKRCGFCPYGSRGLKFTSNGNNTCYVSGIGDCKDTDIIIPTLSPNGDKVTAIGKNAFDGCTTLTSVTFFDNITDINNYAFRGCISLNSVTFGSSLTTIGSYAFSGCTSLTSIELPASVKTIGDYAFDGCTLIDTIVLNEGLNDIGYNAFASTAITELVIPNSVTTIYYNNNYNYSMVENCQKLKRVVFGTGVSKIPSYCFQDLPALEEVVIGSNVKTICPNAFDGCTALTSIVIPDNVTAIDSRAFIGCVNLENISWSKSLTTIGSYAFSGCTSLTSIELPASVKTIGDYAFDGCTLIDTIVLNEGLSDIGYNAFASTAITELVIPNSVTTIYYNNNYNYSMVENCQKLKRVVFGTGVSKIPSYCFQDLPALEEVVIGSNVKTICPNAFDGCTALTSIVIPDNVTAIDSYAFSGCVNLKNISWSKSLTTIGTYAFSGCTSLTSVKLPASVKIIDDYAFDGCTLLDTIVLNEGLTDIGYNAFASTAITELVIPNSVTTIYYNNNYNYSMVENCQKLKRVVFGTGVSKIPSYCFQDLPALEEVVIGSNVKTICLNAFDGCTALESIVIPDNVTAIDSRAFIGCVNLKNITWSRSLTTIGTYAFSGCTSLTSVKLPASVKIIDDYAFDGCTLLDTIVLNEGLTDIGYNAFASTAIIELVIPDSVTTIHTNNNYNYSMVENCQKLKRVVFGTGVTTVPAFLFQGLQALEEVVIGEKVTAIGSYAFDGCVSLVGITIPESVTTINSYAFRNSGLKNIAIPKNVSTVGDYAFSGCQKLEYLLIDGTALSKIGKNVTSSCPSARRIYYKGTVNDWNAISINSTNAAPFNQIPYVYSEYSPAEEGNYWHYSINGMPVVWDISLSEYKVYSLSNVYNGTMGSSLLSCSTGYIKEMEADNDFMVQKALYEAATIIGDLGEALENQMSRKQLYTIVLLDVLGYNYSEPSETPELAGKILTYGTFAGSYIENADKLLDTGAFKEAFEAIDFVGTGFDVISGIAETSQDKKIASQYLLGFAMQCRNSVDILKSIADDTKNDKDLRNAANDVIDIIESAFSGTLQELIDNKANAQFVSNIAAVAISNVWDYGCSLYLPLQIAQWVADGVKITLDLFCDTGVSVDAYYKLKVTSVIENALRYQINSLNGDYLRRETLSKYSLVYAVVDLYCSAITKGYEYTLDYLDSVGKDMDYIYSLYVHNTEAFKQFEAEVENEYELLYGSAVYSPEAQIAL